MITCEEKTCLDDAIPGCKYCPKHAYSTGTGPGTPPVGITRVFLGTTVMKRWIIELHGPAETTEREAMELLANVHGTLRANGYILQLGNIWQLVIRTVSVDCEPTILADRNFVTTKSRPEA